MSEAPVIKILQEDCLSVNQLKREHFRMNIRKKKLESLFRQNRMIHKLGDKDNVQGTLDSLQQFFRTDNADDLNKFNNLADSQDMFEIYNVVSQCILDIKYYLTQPLNNEAKFKEMYLLLNNCIIVNPSVTKQLLRDDKGKSDTSLLLQIVAILSLSEWKQLHATVLEILNQLIEQESEVLDILQQEKALIESLVYWAFDLGSERYLQCFTEFLSLYLQFGRTITFKDQFHVTQDLLQRAVSINNLQITYGIMLLVKQLDDGNFAKLNDQILSLLENYLNYLKLEITQDECTVIFKIFRMCLKKSPDILLYMLGYDLIEILYTQAQQLQKQAGKDCLRLVTCCYSTYQEFLKQYNSNDDTLKEYAWRQLIRFLEPFIDFYMNSSFNINYKIKVLNTLVGYRNFIHFRMQNQTQLDPESYIKYFEILESMLDTQSDSVESILNILDSISRLIQIEDRDFQQAILKLFPVKLIEKLQDLSLHKNELIVEEASKLNIFYQFC